MTDDDYKSEAAQLDSSTRTYIRRQAYEEGALAEESITAFADRMTREVKAGADEYFDLSDLALRQAILEEVGTAVERMVEDGYDEHF